MSLSRIFPGIENFPVLTSKGLIGRFEPDDGFHIFERLSESLGEQSNKLLRHYNRTPEPLNIRLALIVPSAPTHIWKSATLVLGDSVINQIFTVNTAAANQMTQFQRRNRQRSIYQGMELLLSYKNKSMPGVPPYCPILYGPGKTLADYPDYAALLHDEMPSNCSVFEVLNYIGLMLPSERTRIWVKELIHLIRSVAIQKNQRHGSDLTLQE